MEDLHDFLRSLDSLLKPKHVEIVEPKYYSTDVSAKTKTLHIIKSLRPISDGDIVKKPNPEVQQEQIVELVQGKSEEFVEYHTDVHVLEQMDKALEKIKADKIWIETIPISNRTKEVIDLVHGLSNEEILRKVEQVETKLKESGI